MMFFVPCTCCKHCTISLVLGTCSIDKPKMNWHWLKFKKCIYRWLSLKTNCNFLQGYLVVLHVLLFYPAPLQGYWQGYLNDLPSALCIYSCLSSRNFLGTLGLPIWRGFRPRVDYTLDTPMVLFYQNVTQRAPFITPLHLR